VSSPLFSLLPLDKAGFISDHFGAQRSQGSQVQALEIAHRGYVLQSGRVVQTGSAKELLDSEEIRRAYMGT
jgi:ABC-type lipopolysaccharide export system ATPase subunit